MVRGLVLALVWALAVSAISLAAERIEVFDVAIEVDVSGDITVTETIAVIAEGDQIRRGIFRDLPRYHLNDGARLAYDYDVESVTRDTRPEPYAVEGVENAFRIRIGDGDVLIPQGRHVYEIRYRVKNQVRYFDSYDELYWNVTGAYWALPIASARARIRLPRGARILQTSAYTGPLGATETDFRYQMTGGAHFFETTRPLNAGEGLTVALGFEKGLIDPPTAGERRALWWARNGSLVLLLTGLAGAVAYYRGSFERIGRDPPKGPVFARYQPPEGYSPAAVHHIYYRGLRNHDALIATLTNLAVKGRLHINAESKKSTTLTPAAAAEPKKTLDGDDKALEAGLFQGGALTFRGKYDSAFTKAYGRFRRRLGRAYGRPYFRWNRGSALLAIAASVIIVMIAVGVSTLWTLWHTLAVLALAAINALFLYLLPAPTRKGQDVRTAIEGFRLYLNTAEKLHLNAVEPGSDAPPPMTAERYEVFLPFAIALGVEEPWTRYFERVLPEEAAGYHPHWTSRSTGRDGSLHALNRAIVANIASGVTSAMPQSSSSSGSGGGGSSGGGGGGGGGGGW